LRLTGLGPPHSMRGCARPVTSGTDDRAGRVPHGCGVGEG